MQSATSRRPEITLEALEWGAPGWIGVGQFYPQSNLYVNGAKTGASGQSSYITANTSDYLLTQKSAGGDQWYGFGTLTTSADAVVNGAVYLFNGLWIPTGSANMSCHGI